MLLTPRLAFNVLSSGKTTIWLEWHALKRSTSRILKKRFFSPFAASVAAASRHDKTSIGQGALQACGVKRGEEREAGCSAPQRAQCGEV